MTIDVMMIGLRSVGQGQGGVERHAASLAAEYEQIGLRTCLVVRTPYASSDKSSLGKNTWTKALWSPKHAIFEAPVHSVIATIYAAIKRPRILHIHAVGPSLVVPLARLFGLKVVCTHHGEDYAREKWGKVARSALLLGERFQARYAHARICVSRSLARRLSQHYGSAFEYIPNAVSPMKAVSPYPELKKFGVTPGRYIVNVGRLVPEKRQNDLIAAYAALDRPGYKLVLVGAADHESPYSEELKRLAASTPGVVMAGYQGGDTLAQLIGAAAIFALPSSHEGMPIAALEAMGLGRPVVLSDIAPNLDLGLPGESYHALGSIESLSGKLRDCIDKCGDTLPNRDWSDYLAAFTWPAVARATIAVYERVSPRITPQ